MNMTKAAYWLDEIKWPEEQPTQRIERVRICPPQASIHVANQVNWQVTCSVDGKRASYELRGVSGTHC